MTQSDISKKNQSSDIPINRGVELILAGGGSPKPQKKPLGIRFENVVSLLRREFHFTFEFSLSINKKKTITGDVPCQKR